MSADIFQATPNEELVPAGPLRALRWLATDRQAPHSFLFVHGLWAGAQVWRRLGPYLAKHGYTTHAVWLRHHHPGASRSQLKGVGIEDFAADVLAATRELGRPILVGHSLGGLIAQVVAARECPPGLALLSSAAPRGIPTLHRGRRTLRAIPKFLGWPFRSDPLVMEFPYARGVYFSHLGDEDAAQMLAHHVPGSRRAVRQVAFWPPRVRRQNISCPVLVAGGAEDYAVIPWVTRRLAARYRVVPAIYPGRGHMLQLESGWESVGDDLMRWADRFVE